MELSNEYEEKTITPKFIRMEKYNKYSRVDFLNDTLFLYGPNNWRIDQGHFFSYEVLVKNEEGDSITFHTHDENKERFCTALAQWLSTGELSAINVSSYSILNVHTEVHELLEDYGVLETRDVLRRRLTEEEVLKQWDEYLDDMDKIMAQEKQCSKSETG